MNGQDKGLVLYKDSPLIEHLLGAFSPQVSSCIISANRNITDYQQYGHPVYRDEFGDYAGPLAGIATGLKHCQTDWLACIPCDAFCIPTNLVQHLYQQTIRSNTSIGIVDDGSRWQPLYAVIHKRILSDLEAYLHTGNKRVMQWVKKQNPVIVDFSKNKKLFQNINSFSDLENSK